MTTPNNVAQVQAAEDAARAAFLHAPTDEHRSTLLVAIDSTAKVLAAAAKAAAEAKQIKVDEFRSLEGEGVHRWRAEDAPLLAHSLDLEKKLAEAKQARLALVATHAIKWNRRAALAAELGISNTPGPCPSQAHVRAETLLAEHEAGTSPHADLRDLARAIAGLFEILNTDLVDDLGPEGTIRAILDGTYHEQRRVIIAQREALGKQERAQREAARAAAELARRAEMARRGERFVGRGPRGEAL